MYQKEEKKIFNKLEFCYYVVRYPLARAKNRKIIFHAGPTNSGKTYHALERFINAKSGVYCAPLKLLVAEVYHKCNERVGINCMILFSLIIFILSIYWNIVILYYFREHHVIY